MSLGVLANGRIGVHPASAGRDTMRTFGSCTNAIQKVVNGFVCDIFVDGADGVNARVHGVVKDGSLCEADQNLVGAGGKDGIGVENGLEEVVVEFLGGGH